MAITGVSNYNGVYENTYASSRKEAAQKEEAVWEIPFTNVCQYLILIMCRRLLNQEAAYSKGLLPSQVINLGGDNR